MSRKRQKPRSSTRHSSPRNGASVQAKKQTRSSNTHRLKGRAALIVVLGIMAWGVARLQKPNVILPPLPVIQLANLETNVATLLQSHLQEVEAQKRSGKAWGQLGSFLKSLGYRQEAATCLKAAMDLAPNEPRWPYLLATLNAESSSEESLTYLRQTVALCENDPPMPRLRLARLLAETGRHEEAQKELQALLKVKPDSGPAQLLLAQIHQTQGDEERASRLALNCSTNPYTARTAWHLLAAIHRRQGDTNAADQAIRRAAAVTPDAAWPDPFEEELLAWRTDARSLSDRAQSLLVAGRLAEAWPLVEQLARDHAEFPETWLLLGRAQFMQRKPVEAEQSLRHFLEMDPKSVNGHFQLGMSLMAQQRFLEAADTFRHTTTLKPDFGPAFFNLGFALARAGQSKEAMPAFEEAIRHNPEYIDSYILLADLHVTRGETGQARKLASLAGGINPDDARLPTLWNKIREAE